MEEPRPAWRRCSACKKPIGFGARHWTCSVSTCTRKRTGLAFCSVSCWEVHLPTARHREAWAVERHAPDGPELDRSSASRAPSSRRRRLIRNAPAAGARGPGADPPLEILIIASRLKDYVRTRSGLNTSDRVLEPLSEVVRRVCDQAIRNAVRDGRKTLLDRDIESG